MRGNGGWVEGDAVFVGQNPPSGAVITYYQRTRHTYGRLKLEIVDAGGKVIDTLTATRRRGVNRAEWSMQVKGQRVPRAAQAAFSATQGPRVVPGTYTVRLTRGADVVETKLVVGGDRRAAFSAADRKAQFDAASRIQAMFGEMSNLTDKLDAARHACKERAKDLPPSDPLAAKLSSAAGKLEDAKKLIVATREGGAITGEERIREHLDILYGAVNGWDGRPTKYQLDRIDALHHELTDVETTFAKIVADDLKPLDQPLRDKKLDPIPTTASRDPDAEDEEIDRRDPDAIAAIRCMEARGITCETKRAAAANANERD
jgi:hypothetical protein